MKSENGITVISVTIYIIVLTIMIAILASVSSYFYKNTALTNEDIEPITEFTRFNSYFSDEVNHGNLKIVRCDTNQEESFIIFGNDVQYIYNKSNKGIFRIINDDKVKICKYVDSCEFSAYEQNEKTKINVNITFENGTNKNITYTLK